MSLNASLRRFVIGGAVLLQCAQTAYAQVGPGEMDGVWEGSISVVGVTADSNRNGFRVGDSIRLRLEFFPDRERVSVSSPDFPELRMVHIGQLSSSAIILGVMRADDRTENWALTVSLHDERTMLVALSRGVRQMQNPDGADVLAVGAVGQLRQVDDD